MNAKLVQYVELKNRPSSFDTEVDRELAKYVHALDNFVLGTVLWYYLRPNE
ncbi:hypothetical protein JVU11DRAFT_135 [Chiua virens]|nr:hypothetical protein JVU11DRAFT_135 [Chiua virens]